MPPLPTPGNKFEGFRSVVFGVWETMKLAGQGIANIFAPNRSNHCRRQRGQLEQGSDGGPVSCYSISLQGRQQWKWANSSRETTWPKAWSKGKVRAESGEGTIDFKALTDKFTKPFAAALGGRKQAGSTTTATDEYGSPGAPTNPRNDRHRRCSRSANDKAQSAGNAGGIHIKFDNLLVAECRESAR